MHNLIGLPVDVDLEGFYPSRGTSETVVCFRWNPIDFHYASKLLPRWHDRSQKDKAVHGCEGSYFTCFSSFIGGVSGSRNGIE